MANSQPHGGALKTSSRIEAGLNVEKFNVDSRSSCPKNRNETDKRFQWERGYRDHGALQLPLGESTMQLEKRAEWKRKSREEGEDLKVKVYADGGCL